jgi:hypothetical protein
MRYLLVAVMLCSCSSLKKSSIRTEDQRTLNYVVFTF